MKILIVEDNATELARAVKIAIEMGIEVVTATDAHTGSRLATQTNWNGGEATFTPLVDGVITDIFMPLYTGDEDHGHSDNPCGIMVQAAAQAGGIPCIFCTGGYHHGPKFQWIQNLCTYVQCGMIDSGRSKEMDAPKKWKDALEAMKHWIERKAKTV